MRIDDILSKNILPDFLIRIGIRRLLKQRLKELNPDDPEQLTESKLRLIKHLAESPIAVETDQANEQHYEVPTEFYQKVLGKNLKYSSGYWNSDTTNLDDAEDRMLEITCSRAELKDGQDILELGCGWGSLTLYMARRYPNAKILAVSNSSTQREFILSQSRKRGLRNIQVLTCDMNRFDTDMVFDRVVSVEMFEHMRNYRRLMRNISHWLRPQGRLFVHIFVHNKAAYPFESNDDSDWMARYFFTGGIMPSEDLLLYFQEHMSIKKQWHVPGLHYSKTAQAWLKNMDQNRNTIFPLFEDTYGKEQALKWWCYWRIFFMACSELWEFRNGTEWHVAHYLFQPSTVSVADSVARR